MPDIFISSCSRRQMARRRPQARGGMLRLQLLFSVAVCFVALAAFALAHGGV